MATYEVKPTEQTLHGPFSRDRSPILTIASGDSVHFRTLDAGWGLEPFPAEGARKRFTPAQPGHALCGPIAIAGAKAGMVLEIQVNRLVPGPYAWTAAGGFMHEVNQRLGLSDGQGIRLDWTLDRVAMVGVNQFGQQIPLRPFMGVMGLAPAEKGLHATAPPRLTGGNIDCKELVQGTSLFLPVAVDGGLFSVGDGHAAQGDGEVSVTALECPMDLVDLTFYLHADMHVNAPRAKTHNGWITFGFHEDLDEAAFLALAGMLDLMQELHGLERSHALALASACVDLRITQIVNGSKGVHAILPHGAVASRG